jgi:hypothetical protein
VLSPSPHTRPAVCGPVHHPPTPISPHCLVANRHHHLTTVLRVSPWHCPYSSQHIPLPQTPHRTANTWTTNTTRSVTPHRPPTYSLWQGRIYREDDHPSVCLSMIRVCLASFKLTTHLQQRPASAPVVSCRAFGCFLLRSRCLIHLAYASSQSGSNLHNSQSCGAPQAILSPESINRCTHPKPPKSNINSE